MAACAPYIPAELSPRVGAKATRTTNQSIPNAAVTVVTWPNEAFDSSTYFTPGGSVFTVPSGKAGLYVVYAKLDFASSVLAANFLRIIAGGVTYDFGGPSGTGGGIQSGSLAGVDLAVGDTIAVSTFHTQGGAVNVTGGRLAAYLIGL